MAGESILVVGRNPVADGLVSCLGPASWRVSRAADIEKRVIVQALERVDGSQKKAAERLRLNATTLHEKMKRYKLLRERSRRTTAPFQ